MSDYTGRGRGEVVMEQVKQHLANLAILTDLDVLAESEYREALRQAHSNVLALREALQPLQVAWEADDKGGTDFRPIVAAVRDVFGGLDGRLASLHLVGRR